MLEVDKDYRLTIRSEGRLTVFGIRALGQIDATFKARLMLENLRPAIGASVELHTPQDQIVDLMGWGAPAIAA